MYRQRNTSGVYVHFNMHGYKTILHKYNGLKCDKQVRRNCCFKAFFDGILRSWVLETCRMHVEVHAKSPIVLIDFKKIVTNQGITVNIGNIQIHNNAFWISPVVT